MLKAMRHLTRSLGLSSSSRRAERPSAARKVARSCTRAVCEASVRGRGAQAQGRAAAAHAARRATRGCASCVECMRQQHAQRRACAKGPARLYSHASGIDAVHVEFTWGSRDSRPSSVRQLAAAAASCTKLRSPAANTRMRMPATWRLTYRGGRVIAGSRQDQTWALCLRGGRVGC